MINKEQKPNPQEDQIRPFFLDLLIEEPPTMTHKDLQKSTMAWTAKLCLVLKSYAGSKYIVDLRNMQRFKKILWCNYEITSNKL